MSAGSPARRRRAAAWWPRSARDAHHIISGFNILSLAGFVVMGLTVALGRSGQAGKALSIGLICAGTALVFIGLYTESGSR